MGRKPSKNPKSGTIGIAAPATVQSELKALAKELDRSSSYLGGKFLLRGWAAYKRDGLFDEPESEGAPIVHYLDLVGRVSAGAIVEAVEEKEKIPILSTDIEGVRTPRALRVIGDSMVDANIVDGDIILVGDCPDPRNRIVVAYVKEHGTAYATVKRWRQHGKTVTLEPANRRYKAESYPESKLDWYGAVIKVLRTVERPEDAEEEENKDAA
jgi:SOS-response transcriptional repressor LexA